MSYISNKISGLTTLSNFTAKVIQDNSPQRYGNTTSQSIVFTVGREYRGPNIDKRGSRPPRLRILSVFRPLINGNPNSDNDTYVAFSVFDHSLGVFRGPSCRRTQLDAQIVYNDFYVTTIDKFGKNYGNLFTGLGSSESAFTAPQANFSTALSATVGGVTLTVNAGHYTGCFMLGGRNNTSLDFNGFFALSGLNGKYCFYTIGDNGSRRQFRNTVENSQYTSNIYPYLTPVTNKYTSEWRCAPICSLDDAGYTPLIRPGSGISSGGQIKYKATSANPSFDFDNDISIIPVYVWTNYDGNDWVPFYAGKLFANGGGEQGASGYAPAGYYGLYNLTVYGYWDGNGNWSQVTDYGGGGGGGFNALEFQFKGPYFDPNSACDERDGAEFFRGFIDGDLYQQPDLGVSVFDDSDGLNPISWAPPGTWFKVFDSGYNPLGDSVTFDGMVISDKFRCP
jgi:hypothetical protein